MCSKLGNDPCSAVSCHAGVRQHVVTFTYPAQMKVFNTSPGCCCCATTHAVHVGVERTIFDLAVSLKLFLGRFNMMQARVSFLLGPHPTLTLLPDALCMCPLSH